MTQRYIPKQDIVYRMVKWMPQYQNNGNVVSFLHGQMTKNDANCCRLAEIN